MSDSASLASRASRASLEDNSLSGATSLAAPFTALTHPLSAKWPWPICCGSVDTSKAVKKPSMPGGSE